MWQCKHTFSTFQPSKISVQNKGKPLSRVCKHSRSHIFLTNFTVSLCIHSFPTHVKLLPSVLAVTSAALNTTNPRGPGFESPAAPIFCAFSTLHFFDKFHSLTMYTLLPYPCQTLAICPSGYQRSPKHHKPTRSWVRVPSRTNFLCIFHPSFFRQIMFFSM